MDRKDKIKALRQSRGLTQQQLADRAGMSRVDISRIESGYNQATSFRVMKKLASAFGMSVADLEAHLDGDEGKRDIETKQLKISEMFRPWGPSVPRAPEYWDQIEQDQGELPPRPERKTSPKVLRKVFLHPFLGPDTQALLDADLEKVEDLYPNLAHAIDALREEGAISDDAVDTAKRIALLFRDDLHNSIWIVVLLALEV